MACCLLYRGDVVPKENYPLFSVAFSVSYYF
jgi:hypothetical protein